MLVNNSITFTGYSMCITKIQFTIYFFVESAQLLCSHFPFQVEGDKQKIDNIQLKIDNIFFKNQHKIVVDLLKLFKIDKEQIRINTTKTDKNGKKQLKSAQIRPQISKKHSEIDSKLTKTNIRRQKTDLTTSIFMDAFRNTYKYTFLMFGQPQLRRRGSIFHVRMKKNVS